MVCLWPGRVLEPVPRARRRDDQPGKRLLDHETSVGGDGVHARNRPNRARRDAPQTSFDVSFVKFVRFDGIDAPIDLVSGRVDVALLRRHLHRHLAG